MPTLLRLKSFRCYFYQDDRESKQVHVAKGKETAKIDLDRLELIQASMKGNSLAQALGIVKEHQEHLLRKWNEYLGD